MVMRLFRSLRAKTDHDVSVYGIEVFVDEPAAPGTPVIPPRGAQNPGAARPLVHGRAEWKAVAPTEPWSPDPRPWRVTLHHSDGKHTTTLAESEAEARFIQDFHIHGRGWIDIAYHFLVDSQGNILEGLPFADGAFDYTHMRLLLFAIPEARWPDVARELVRVTRPGGWIELVETGPQRNGGPAMDQVVNWITQASLKRGINPLLGPSIGGFLSQAGVPNVSAREIALPVGAYGGRVGRLAETDVFGVLQGVKGLVAAQNLATPEQYDNAVMAAKADLNNYQCALPFYIAYGQRPA